MFYLRHRFTYFYKDYFRGILNEFDLDHKFTMSWTRYYTRRHIMVEIANAGIFTTRTTPVFLDPETVHPEVLPKQSKQSKKQYQKSKFTIQKHHKKGR